MYESELEQLAHGLDSGQIVDLYNRFKSYRLEAEWRNEFLSILEVDERILPPLEHTLGEIVIPPAVGERKPNAVKRWWKFW